ncbi:hypothetical protein BKM63_14225 [Flavobacterium johnsoniae]|jgi:hypothetical protein|uniref:Uncharacterized protein n=1 Tax=Flavobacterium johnsoniae TaxID=986 RepID=A0A1J7CPT6_FLAJO|nr:hypothetical protein BKM63_14225 [Flavobacterium johnsoniae]
MILSIPNTKSILAEKAAHAEAFVVFSLQNLRENLADTAPVSSKNRNFKKLNCYFNNLFIFFTKILSS